jgi:hypothetical protein
MVTVLAGDVEPRANINMMKPVPNIVIRAKPNGNQQPETPMRELQNPI